MVCACVWGVEVCGVEVCAVRMCVWCMCAACSCFSGWQESVGLQAGSYPGFSGGGTRSAKQANKPNKRATELL